MERERAILPAMSVPPDLSFSIEDDPTAEDRDFIERNLIRMNRQRWPAGQGGNFAVFLRDRAGRIEAGLDAIHYGGWLFVHNLWITEARRRQGLGRLIMTEAERRARALGCHSAWLDTFSFQAPDFYQRLGYQIFGTLDHPPGVQRFFLRKSLV
jgi:GNAT superfamily N-acetyltransferase